ncbi:MAG: LytTR family transcriptional regulator DNA-binding domain-containing protein [Lachnospiraceae bacterium]|nr:LytTR family transcriptional regulator DNA-binding domain-containing protein [Lachnospiraceae bacterium]
MRLIMRERQELTEPEVTVEYREMTGSVKRVADFVRTVEQTISGRKEGEEYTISLQEIYYVESVDKKTFIYCEKDVYQSNRKLYELEEVLIPAGFVRVSKSIILNIEMLKGVKSLVNSRLEAILSNGERICVTRKYLKDIRGALLRRNGQ